MPKKLIKVVIGIIKAFEINGFIPTKSTKNLRDNNMNPKENKYTKKYIGRTIIDFSLDLKVYSLLNIKPNNTPDKKPAPAEIK